jgi:hypothetical protein
MANLPADRRIQIQSNTGTGVINGAAGAAPTTGAPNQQQPQGQQGLTTNTQGAAPQTAQNTPQKSSGMFTNIKSYIQRNQPQAQKMAGAITGDFSKQANNIAQQAQQREQQFKNQITTQQGNIQAQAALADKVIGQAANYELKEGQQANAENLQTAFAQPQPEQPPQPPAVGEQPPVQQTPPPVDDSAKQSEKAFSDFQNIITGANEQDLYAVNDLDLSKQQNVASQLETLSKGAGTEQGRAALLDRTFSKNRQYTTGQSGLDTAILGGDRNALQDVKNLTNQSTQGLSKELKQKYFQSLSDRANLQSSAENLKTDVAKKVGEAMDKTYTEVEQEAENRKNKAIETQDSIKNMLKTGQGLTQDTINQYMDVSSIDQAKNRALYALKEASQGQSPAVKKQYFEEAFGQDYNATRNKLSKSAINNMKNASNKDPLAVEFRALENKALRGNLTPAEERRSAQIVQQKEEERYQEYVADKVKGVGESNSLNYLQNMIARGEDPSQFLQMKGVDDLTAQNVASENQLARYELLKRLKGDLGQGKLDMNKERYVRGGEASGKYGKNVSARDLVRLYGKLV